MFSGTARLARIVLYRSSADADLNVSGVLTGAFARSAQVLGNGSTTYRVPSPRINPAIGPELRLYRRPTLRLPLDQSEGFFFGVVQKRLGRASLVFIVSPMSARR